jgi:hypothetical protein
MPGPGITRVDPNPVSSVDKFGNPIVNPDAPVAADPSQGKIEVPKPQEILDLEKKLGREVEPIYATGQVQHGSGTSQPVEYGPPIGYRYDNGQSQYVNFDTKGTQTGIQQRGGQFQQILPILAAIFLPGVGSAIANALLDAGIVTSEVAANVIGNAIANTASSVAQGQPLDKALTNAIVGAAVSTGSVAVAKEVNSFIGNPAVSDAIVSAAGSAVKTAAAGGTEQDIINNMTGALAGSAASSAYQLGGEDYTRQTGRVIGSAVAGAVTGGGAGAITGALGELGSQSKGKVAGTIEDTFRGTTDTGALPASQVEALNQPTATGELAPVTVTGQTTSDVTGTNIISPNAVTSTPTPTPSPPVVEQPPAPAPVAETVPPPQDKAILDLIASPATPSVEPTPTPPLEPVTVAGTKTADITDTDIINTIAKETTPVATTPVIDTPVVPTPPKLEDVEVSGKALPKATDITDTDIINTIAAETKPVGELQRVEIREKALPTDITKTDIIEEPAKLQDVTVTGTREEPLALETKTITGKADGTLAPVTITAKADEPVVTPEEKKTKEPAPKEKPYKPDLFILGGKQPKAPTKPSDSVLSQALGTTTGLTASRGAGEIEDPSTGKKKRKVWNEETLRLKDALGV